MQNIYLSPHFTLAEMCESQTAEKHGIANIPSSEAVANMRRLCEGCLEPLREALGLPIIITSGYRTKALNNHILHSARKSQHVSGQAADFYVEGASRRELLIKAFRQIILDEDIDYDQLILYPTFIHVSYVSRTANRHKLTKANGHGTYCGLSREQALAIY
jgi:hypothetical protein